MNIKLVLASSLFLLTNVTASIAETTVIHAGKLIAVPGEKILKEQSIIIEDNIIKDVVPGYVESDKSNKSTKIVNLKDYVVMPGLIDMHVHLQYQFGPNRDKDLLKMSDELVSMRSVYHAKKTLLAGFTTVRDVGSDGQSMYALRDAINKGWVEGPRIIAAGVVGITGGHVDISGIKPDLMEMYTAPTICDGPYDCRRAARNAIKYGADLIKIASTGGVLTDRATGTGQQMEIDELKEIVRAAKSMGKKVTAHAHHEDGIVAALEAGVASIEHGSYTNNDSIKLFKKTGAYLIPTLLAGETVVTMARNSKFMTPAIREKATRVGGDMKTSFSKAYKAGVKIAFGTDSAVSKHGDNAQEAVLMTEAGMSPTEVIIAATINAADLLEMSSQLGTIEVGKHADIIATNGSPISDIKELLTVDFVMKEGNIYKQQN